MSYFHPKTEIEELADRAYVMAQKRPVAIIITHEGPMVTETTTLRFRQAKDIIGTYNKEAAFSWILEDLKVGLPSH